MKKGVVLFISLLFIAAVSLLILKNLEDTDSYISEQNSKFSKTQIMFYLNNAKNEISKALVSNKDNDISSYLDEEYPIFLEDAKIIIKLQEYDKYNINLLKKDDEKANYYVKLFLQSNGVYDIETFKYLLKNSEEITNYKQLDELIKDYSKNSYNSKISNIKYYLGFIDFDKKEFVPKSDRKELKRKRSNEDIAFYELFVTVDYLKQYAKAYYILNKNGGVEYFEYSFK